jgi:hypothetical protein
LTILLCTHIYIHILTHSCKEKFGVERAMLESLLTQLDRSQWAMLQQQREEAARDAVRPFVCG